MHTWAEWALRTLLVGISAFAVAYLRDIGQETSSLTRQFVELKYEIKRLAENQLELNNNLTKQLKDLEKRVYNLEQRGER